MAGAHTSEKRWYKGQNPEGNLSIADQVQTAAKNVVSALEASESMYGEMQELFLFAGGTMQLLADQLFKEKWEARAESAANATELAMTQDAFDAVTAMHELYQAMTNIAVVQEDRLGQLRRMT